ncbi:MAG: MaoC family dehydratase N-terminal domain-containing protein [Alphaproteobacteria bacterium]|nr:MaoC family dehydratase N-terminal domain-containing protein [Alphaproteobacteria bacterium]MBU0798717.1 MaoC family dehydratase N-terminal domain-containing protein [Alphaproteobacteria bacterium]MBU0885980.1 MaoC family dehydratase N-terminal domain-containing protein [Alphaproteobacteria bacterium]MBU1811969.1 MaoC family dehydratase N-terminal domain-containing protein [Alphaproteobacteria bacterium]MBU2089804.1 MaoC family dehydratase N-terminal domain-containing protein [Alphaproteobac
MTIDAEKLQAWVGKREEQQQLIPAWPVGAWEAMLDHDRPEPKEGDALPPGAHWIFFNPVARTGVLDEDGHPKRGGFLPPVELPRRMWAGGRLQFGESLKIGDTATKVSEILSVTVKEGRTGPLIFVTVKHTLSGSAGVAIVEEHDIVYRGWPTEAEKAKQPPAAPPVDDAIWSREVVPTPPLLFRYSALTFNGHRIHYDQPYVTQVEGYPGLIVHGPLMATLLLDLVRRERPAARLTGFEFRGMSPVFDTAPFTVNGKPVEGGAELWIGGPGNYLGMKAQATFS